MRLNGLGFFQKLARLGLFCILGFSLIAMSGWDSQLWDGDSLVKKVRSKGEIIVLTTKNPLIYSEDINGQRAGIDYELLTEFARYYGLNLRFNVLRDQAAVLEALKRGSGDIAAARMPAVAMSREGFLVGPALEETHLSLFCHKKKNVTTLANLKDRTIALLEKDNINNLDKRIRNYVPGADLKIIVNSSVQQIIGMTVRGEFDCAIAENLEGLYFTRSYSSIEAVTVASDNYSLNWLIPPDNQDLISLLNSWFQIASRKGDITRAQNKYISFLTHLDIRDIRQFAKSKRTKLPKWERYFRDAGKENDLDWHLIAAVAYQESHWDAEAQSYTGVRGLMQLTEITAEHLGIEDRKDPIQSIKGGSSYLKSLIEKIPASVNNYDRINLALAAYNFGYGHLLDAQKLAVKKGLNPWSWIELKKILPLLEDPSIYQDLEYGRARGTETVAFVDRVRAYEHLWFALR